jgi:hypothetical protein
MKMMSRSGKRHYAQIVCIFFALTALAVAIGGCGEGEGDSDYYILTISSTNGGSVTTPGESDFWYPTNTTTVVELVAEAIDGCHFVNWTGDVDTVGNVTAAATNITMYDSYSITANFELDDGYYSLSVFRNYGGSVVEPGEGCFAYAANTTVELVAVPYNHDAVDFRFKNWAGDVDAIADINAAATNVTMHASYSIWPWFEWYDIIQVVAGSYHTVGLKSDGTVVAAGYHYGVSPAITVPPMWGVGRTSSRSPQVSFTR